MDSVVLRRRTRPVASSPRGCHAHTPAEAAALNHPECHPDKASFNALCHSFALKQASIFPPDTKREDSELAQLPFATYLLPFLALRAWINDATPRAVPTVWPAADGAAAALLSLLCMQVSKACSLVWYADGHTEDEVK